MRQGGSDMGYKIVRSARAEGRIGRQNGGMASLVVSGMGPRPVWTVRDRV